MGVEMEKRTEEQRSHSKDELEKFQAAIKLKTFHSRVFFNHKQM